ncbi:hypothetical protein C8Q76DRAFT_104381 [Earliella scabrosa]|nr:hypothetical protein C8Q76DRAFT_104381 [Earliella scabrosa]
MRVYVISGRNKVVTSMVIFLGVIVPCVALITRVVYTAFSLFTIDPFPIRICDMKSTLNKTQTQSGKEIF